MVKPLHDSSDETRHYAGCYDDDCRWSTTGPSSCEDARKHTAATGHATTYHLDKKRHHWRNPAIYAPTSPRLLQILSHAPPPPPLPEKGKK